MPINRFSPDGIALSLSLALFGEAPGATTFNSYKQKIATDGASAFASTLAGALASLTDAQFATTVLNNLGIKGNTALEGALTALLAANGAGARGQITLNLTRLLSGLESDTNYGTTAKAWNDLGDKAMAYSSAASNNGAATIATLTAVTPAPSAVTSLFTTGLDNLVGTAGNDVFEGYVVNNSNTLQSGDRIDGGAGFDAIVAVLGSSADFAITPRSQNVEEVYIRSQSTDANGNSGGNNVTAHTGNDVIVDAQDMVGVTRWHNVDSRADLVIEDIRILDSQITKDITLRMSNTDPGSNGDKTDWEVYFSPESLRAAGPDTKNSTITFRFIDNGATAEKPVSNLTVDITFSYGNPAVSVTLKGVNAGTAGTYQALVDSINTKLAEAKLAFKAELSTAFKNFTLGNGVVEQAAFDARAITITDPAGGKFNSATYVPSGASQSSFAIKGQVQLGDPTVTGNLITSTIILDNVGRESEAGTLTVGSMSTRTGVERFEITVENNANTSGTPGVGINNTNTTSGNNTSSLQPTANAKSGSWVAGLQSTNNFLREITVVNAETGIADPDYLYVGTGMEQQGNNLTTLRNAPVHLNPDGIVDVRVFDASKMKGDVKLGAAINAESIRKYQNLVDANQDDKADDVAFQYTTGEGNDAVHVQIDGRVLASNSTAITGRHDFSVSVATGAGNDQIQVRIVDGLAGGAQNWYGNQDINRNVTVDGGTGNDTIRTPGAGDVDIRGGDGDDTIYTDNTGAYAGNVYPGGSSFGGSVFVYNNAPGSLDITDLRSDVAPTTAVSGVNAQLTVSYLGFETAVANIGNSVDAAANVGITDLMINQAIKAAINGDAVLNKLLVAEDGPGRTLIVRSISDGVDSAANLTVTFSAKALTPAQLATTGLKLWSDATNTGYNALIGRYATEVATNGATTLIGVNSTSSSDNTVTGGTGNDVMVLGTTVGADTFSSSNEVIKYAANWGNDSIINFDAAGNGIDMFDFTDATLMGAAVSAVSQGTANTTASSVTIAPNVAVPTGSTLSAEILKLYASVDAATQAAATKYMYVSYGTTAASSSIGEVFVITNGTAAGDRTIASVGKIDLGVTAWSGLTVANFGTNFVNTMGPVVPPANNIVVPVSSTGTVAGTAAVDNFTFDVGAARASNNTTQPQVTGFSTANDRLVLDLPNATGNTTLAALSGQQGVTVSVDQINNKLVIGFGQNANASNVITVDLVGVVDSAAVQVTVI